MKLSQFLRASSKLAPALAGVLVCAALVGCATPQVSALRATAEPAQTSAVAPQADLKTVPFFAQREYECGPAALAMVMNAAGVSISPDDLVAEVYLPARKGSLQVEMLAATRQHGLVPYVLQPQLKDLLQEVAAGHPVLVFQNVSLPMYPVWHYAVVVAYDLQRNTITLHSGETERMEMSLYTFERVWARGKYWAMLALPTTELPATADATSFARTVATLEGKHPDVAQQAYATALARWPQQVPLLFGLGNTRYALHQWVDAADAYQQALNIDPNFADAWNNLAQTRLDLGQFKAAKEAIDKAVLLGGTRLAQYQELQTQINSNLRQ